MGSITPVSRKRDPLRGRSGAALRLAVLLLWGLAFEARAGEFLIRWAESRVSNEVYLLDAQIDYRLSPTALEALESGVPLTMRLDILVQRKRRYWLDETVADLEQRYQVRYHALSDQYLVRNLNSGGLYAYPTLGLALEGMGKVRHLPLLDRRLIGAGQHYEVELHAGLDIEELPAPLRPIAYISPSWRLESDWYSWSLTP